MRDLMRSLLACAGCLCFSVGAQPTDGVYQGTLACGPLLTQAGQDGWRVPITITKDQGQVSWSRGDGNYAETGEGRVTGENVRLALRGDWRSGSGRTGGWTGQASLTFAGPRLTGSMTMSTLEGQMTRECAVQAEMQSSPSTGQTATKPPPAAPAPAAARLAQTLPLLAESSAPRWKDAPSYGAQHASNVLQRSTFYLPLFGSVYPAKFEALLDQLPPGSLRGVVIYNHGCGGQWGTETTVSQYFYRWGFAVVAPDFLGREGNKSGCPGGTSEDMRRKSGERSAEGIWQAINPARLAARGQEVQEVISWLKARTRLPIVLSGHSEGCRAIYAMFVTDPQVVGGACIKQGLQPNFEHTWRWNTALPMWQSLEENDPWVVNAGATHVSQLSFARKFESNPAAHTVVVVPGQTHDPLNHENERASLRRWLEERVRQPLTPGQNGMDYEKALPALQQRLRGGG